MSLAEFQRAFADLVASPARVLAARDDSGAVLKSYDLDPRERRRLSKMIADDGMSINCTLFRVNRLIPIYSVLPLTCRWLGERLSGELDAFLETSRDATLQYGPESHRFAAWLQSRIAAGTLPGGPVEDAIRFEIACFDVRTARSERPPDADPHPRKRLLRFRYPIDTVLIGPASSANEMPEPAPENVLLDATGEMLVMHRLAPEEDRSAS